MSTPGAILPGGIVLIDEPASVSLNTFASNGEVLLGFNCRDGGECGQVIIGLSPHQAVQLIGYLNKHVAYYERAIADGNGGARFPMEAKP